MIKMIAAVSTNGVIGKNNSIPWNYPEDMKHFRKMTEGCSVIMGRKTFESMSSKPLPNRQNFIVSANNNLEHDYKVTVYNHLWQAATDFDYKLAPDAWIIGGARLYEEGMIYASEIWLTIIPEIVSGENLVRFPWADPTKFRIESIAPFETDERLKLVKYVRV